MLRMRVIVLGARDVNFTRIVMNHTNHIDTLTYILNHDIFGRLRCLYIKFEVLTKLVISIQLLRL